MKKLINTKKYLPVALALAGFAVVGTAPALAQSFNPEIGTGNIFAVQLWTDCADQAAGCSSERARRFRHDSASSSASGDRAVWS